MSQTSQPGSLPADWADRTPDARHSYRFLHCQKADLTREIGALAGFEPSAPARGLLKHELRAVLEAFDSHDGGAMPDPNATKVALVDELDARLGLGATGPKLTNIELALVARVLDGANPDVQEARR